MPKQKKPFHKKGFFPYEKVLNRCLNNQVSILKHRYFFRCKGNQKIIKKVKKNLEFILKNLIAQNGQTF
ncbi:hypothetical protein Rain11_2203 [Raineya orbicola]|jgi:hypothetical protein|uniref:Transposase n=1 Tax=Raineya orbicola TaxID=2016530 RepID=A0A2N3I9T0_9BACT|nr:hypothetical protein Rain11_2203 [Raineya orbicola]